MLAELYGSSGLFSIIVSLLLMAVVTSWYSTQYPERATVTAVLGVLFWLHGWWFDPEVWLIDGILLVLCFQALSALFATREGWKLIFLFSFIWIALGLLERVLTD